ncbi:CAP domain-containing protein [Nocardioides pocheonensis]|uniref:CAP domain-containing protein n=1 Tax=Nocardioides pocheonensis TaxID=661485 RepID=A0A3N0GNF7_9ACTN|nr:CAP domain-containing protein [Nocardioides pocheonensis]
MNFTEPVASRPGDRHSVRVTRWLWSASLLGLVAIFLIPAAPVQASSENGAAVTRSTTGALTAEYFASRLFARTNYRRVARGCRPLRLDPALVLAAQRHSDLMSYTADLSHRLAGEGDLVARDVAAGYTHWRILAENLAWGQATPRAVFHDWVQSPEHRANLDNCRLRDVGFGVAFSGGRPWVTADFGRHL